MINSSLFFSLKSINNFKLGVGQFYVIKLKKSPAIINNVEELKNFCIMRKIT